MSGTALLLMLINNTVEPPNKGHLGISYFVLCSEVVLFSNVYCYGKGVSFVGRLSLSRRVLYRRLCCICIWLTKNMPVDQHHFSRFWLFQLTFIVLGSNLGWQFNLQVNFPVFDYCNNYKKYFYLTCLISEERALSALVSYLLMIC